MNNPTLTSQAAAAVPKLPICPYCKADPLVWNILDGSMPGMILRQMFCSECRALLTCFPIAIVPSDDGPTIGAPGGHIPGRRLVDA